MDGLQIQTLEVTGADEYPEVNGIYTYSFPLNGKPSYMKNDVFLFYLEAENRKFWFMSKNLNRSDGWLYCCEDTDGTVSVPSTENGNQWSSAVEGAQPVGAGFSIKPQAMPEAKRKTQHLYNYINFLPNYNRFIITVLTSGKLVVFLSGKMAKRNGKTRFS